MVPLKHNASKKTDTIKHTLKLEGFDLEKGKKTPASVKTKVTRKQTPKPLFEETDIRRVTETQNYKGYKKEKLKKTVDALDVDESLEDLLATLNSNK